MRVAGGIGVNETPGRIDQIHAGTKPIERIDEGRDFRRLELEHSADQHGAPDMRRDQPHLPARLVVDEAVSLVAEHSEDGRADRRPVDDRAQEIDEALGLGPLTIQFALGEFAERHQVGGRNRLFEVAEKVPLGGRIDLLKESNRQRPLESEAVRDRDVVDADVLAEKPGAGAADEAGGPFDGALPKRRINGGIVNDADQVAQLLLIMQNRLTSAGSETDRKCDTVFIQKRHSLGNIPRGKIAVMLL